MNFLKYNNAVPVTVAIVMLGGGAAFAASDPSIVYSSTEAIVSIDNTYLVGKDLTAYSPVIQITGVTEDNDYYYTAYTLFSIDLTDSVWKDVEREEVMQVSKSDLGAYRDLGVYVTEKMKDIVSRESQRLRETQKAARAHVSQKVVATEYGGLIGKFLDTKTEQLPGYSPVVQPEPGTQVPESIPPSLGGGATEGAQPEMVASARNSSAPVLKILGNNPTEIQLKASYSDLGAVIVWPADSNLGVKVQLNGVEVQNISLDTTIVGESIITYTVTDQAGNTTTATRTVRVFDPYAAQTQAQDASAPDALIDTTEESSQEMGTSTAE